MRFTLRTTALLSILGAISIQPVVAETVNHGGASENIKGGDTIPPQCEVSAPDAATEPFYVNWFCIDDNSDSQDIRTELWMYRGEGLAGELVGSFLGFPANVHVDEKLLRVAKVADGLPISFKLIARDKAGQATVSPTLTVGTESNNLKTCDLSVDTAATASTGSTTGQPAKNITVTGAMVQTTQTASGLLHIATTAAVNADPCDEISTICSNGGQISFTADLDLTKTTTGTGTGTGTGTVSITPGTVNGVTVSGTFQKTDIVLSSVDVKGTTTVDSAEATITLSCQQ